MKIETVLAQVMSEIDRAEKIHPIWPRNHIHQCAVVSEESGELLQAALNHDEHKGSKRQMITEAVHTAAMAIRFLKNIEETEENAL